jgi:aminoglycoside phosphotransferase (APT) family kinase protein
LPDRDGEDALRSFVESAVGGRVVAMERTAVGSSRVTWFVTAEDAAGKPRALVLRHDSGDGPLSGTDIDLAHEAVVYRALASQPVRIPRLVAEAPDRRSLLIERAAGTEAFGALEPASDRAVVACDFAEALAELHNVDPASLALPGVPHPKDAEEHARLDLARWRGIQHTRVDSPAPVTLLAGAWLAAHPPAHVERSALCHGDAGAGNFLHEDGRVTALLDWEFAHLGDPLDDVAWVLVRSHLLGGEEEMRAALPAWSRSAGLPLDAARIRYYRAVVLLRMAISCQVALGHARRAESAMDSTTYELLLPYLGFLLPQALREAGCGEPGLDELEREARATLDAHPVLRGVARPLTPVEAP